VPLGYQSHASLDLRSTVVLDQAFMVGRAFGATGTPAAVLHIEDPSEIDIALIAAHKDAPVQEKELEGSDGRMVRADG
jgi:hypothetical protein